MDETTGAPYIHCGDRTCRMMLDTAAALLPAAAGALWFAGRAAARVLAGAVGGCVLAEWGLARTGRASWRDGSALVTGLLLALLFPASCPWWAAALGGAAAMAFKALTGGLGRNPCNPAALGRVALLVLPPLRPAPLQEASGRFLLGYTGGSLGEISSVLLLAGALYLLIRRLLPLRIGATALTAAFLTGLCIPDCDALAVAVWGGTALTACFLAADPATSPMTIGLQAAYGAACGAACTLCAFYQWGIAGSCAALLGCNLLFRAVEQAAERAKRRLFI